MYKQMVLFSFPLCIVDCVIFCENSTNWSFFLASSFFLLLLSPFDWHEQATSGYIYFSFPILLFVYVFPTDWWKKYTLKNKQWELVRSEKMMNHELLKKMIDCNKEFWQFSVYILFIFFSFPFFMYFCLSNFHFLYGFMNVLTLKVQYNAVLLQYN